MRICYLADANVQVRRVAEHFQRQGHEVHVVTARPAALPGIPVHSIAGRSGRGRAGLLLGLPAARRLVADLRPDLMHVFYATSYGLLSSFIAGPPVALSPMGTDVLISARRSRLMARMVKRALARASVIFSVAPHMTRSLLDLGADPARIETFPRGVDLARFEARVPRMRDGRAVILSNRRLEPVYNIEQMVRAAPQVCRRFPLTEFRVYGNGSLRDGLRSLADSVGAADSIRFHPAVDHDKIAGILAAADIYVSCSRSDGASVSLMEAMACGLYPVVTDIEANRVWIRDGENGRLVPLDDPGALAAAICDVISSPELAARASTLNRTLIEERADWSSNMPRMEAAYRKLAGLV